MHATADNWLAAHVAKGACSHSHSAPPPTRTAKGMVLQKGHCAWPGGSDEVWWYTKHSVHTLASQQEAVFMLGKVTVQMGHSCTCMHGPAAAGAAARMHVACSTLHRLTD